MKTHNRNRNRIGVVAAIALTLSAAPLMADEALTDLEADTQRIVATPCLATTDSLNALRDIAREEINVETKPVAKADPAQVELAQAGNPGVISELIDLEGVPLVKLSDDDDRKKVYFGISFDGVVGVHGKL